MAYGGSFAHEEWTEVLSRGAKVTDKPRVLHAGDVVRMNDWSPYGDHTILGFDGEGPEALAKVARPYLYASGVGTTGPTPLQGCEIYELPCKHVLEHFKVSANDGRFKT